MGVHTDPPEKRGSSPHLSPPWGGHVGTPQSPQSQDGGYTGQAVTPCPKCIRPNKLISPHPSRGCCTPQQQAGGTERCPPCPPKPSPGTFTGQRVQRLRWRRPNELGGPRPLLLLCRGRAAAKGHAWPNPGRGGHTQMAGWSLGQPSPWWGSLTMEEPLMERKPSPPGHIEPPSSPPQGAGGGVNSPARGIRALPA